MDKSVLWQMSYGMYIVSTKVDGKLIGCIANTAFQITSSPQIIAVSINKENYTNQALKLSGKVALQILSERVESNVIGVFGYSSSANVNKFDSVSYDLVNDIPIIRNGLCGYLIGNVIRSIDVGTHTVFLVEVTDAVKVSDDMPMTYKYYHDVLKGKAPKNAPTFIAPEEVRPVADTSYICSVCGFKYIGDIHRESEEYLCPICMAPRSAFIEDSTK